MTGSLLAIALFSAAQSPVTSLGQETAFLPVDSVSPAAVKISLERGQYVEIDVLQRGADLVVDVVGPEGRIHLTVDSPTGRYEAEEVSFVAPRTGVYHLRIRTYSASEPSTIAQARLKRRLSAPELAAARREAVDWLSNHAQGPECGEADRIMCIARGLDSAVFGARFVGLGEATHGSREFDAFRLAAVHHLIERHGFRVVAIEDSASRWIALRPYVAGRTADPAIPHTWGWIGHDLRAGLLEWIRAWNVAHPTDKVQIIGLDPQDNALSQEILGRFLSWAYADTLFPAWLEISEDLAEADRQATAFAKARLRERHFTILQRIRNRLLADKGRHSRHVVGVTHSQALQAAEIILAFVAMNLFPASESSSRDAYMASFLLDAQSIRGTGGRAIILAHNDHIAAEKGSRHALGSRLRGRFGCEYLAIGTVFGEGSTVAQVSGTDRQQLATVYLPKGNAERLATVLGTVREGPFAAFWPCGTSAPIWLERRRSLYSVGALADPGYPSAEAFLIPYHLVQAYDGVAYFPLIEAIEPPLPTQ